MNKEIYNEDYYQRGLEKRLSLYSNYRWLPELSIPIAHKLIINLGIKDDNKVLDFGCAMGFIVKAFRLLGVNAWGYDISKYATSNVPSEIRKYVSNSKEWESVQWDWIICKDVLEHISYEYIEHLLNSFASCTKFIFVVVPLAINNKYNEPLYELDSTHIIRKDIIWWTKLFERFFLVVSASYKMPGIKENWCTFHANGFFILKK